MQIWLHDLHRGGIERLTREGHNFWPVWTPRDDRNAFTSDRAGAFNLYWKLARGDAPAERLTSSPNIQFPGSWSPDGIWLAYSEFDPDTCWDIWLMPIFDDLMLPESVDMIPAYDVAPDGSILAMRLDQPPRETALKVVIGK